MDEVIKKADVLIEALPYIMKFRGETIVVKIGGSTLENKEQAASIIEDISFMECVGMNPVVVHGGGKAISRGLEAFGIESQFLNGLRVTKDRAIEVVEKVFKEEVNPELIKLLSDVGAKAVALHGDDIFEVEKKEGVCDRTGEKLDWGYVGIPVKVNAEPIKELVKKRLVPLITPLGVGPDGMVHNINADIAAAAVAGAIKARKIAFISDVPGLMRDPEDTSTLIHTLNIDEVDTLKEQGVIAGGMLPKVESGVDALKAGVKKVHFIDGRMPHSLLLEIFTDEGVGTEIISDQ
ncbi:acetylglutamate kinase [bacterium E08(2017)]|nr:acetylglutamate kinase [bacterium E08(2017)]